jgi:hypothetical protein
LYEFSIKMQHINHINSNFATINKSPTAWFLSEAILNYLISMLNLILRECVQKYNLFKKWAKKHRLMSFQHGPGQKIGYNDLMSTLEKWFPLYRGGFCLSRETGVSIESNRSCDALFYVVYCPNVSIMNTSQLKLCKKWS